MRTILRLFIFLVMVLFAIVPPVLNAKAQGTQCYSLSSADCKILTAADANLSKEMSFQYDFDFTVSLNLPNFTKVNAEDKGTGLFAIDSIPQDFSDPATALQGLQLTLNLQQTATTGSSTRKTTASYIILDGTVYTKTGDTDSWDSQSIEDALAQAEATGNLNDNPTLIAMQDALKDPAVMKALAAIPTIKGFVKLQRTANVPVVDGQKQIEFAYTFDIKTLVTAKEMYPVIRALAQVGGATGSIPDSQIAAAARVMANALQGSTLKASRWVGSKDQLYHGLTIDMLFKLDPSALGAAAGSIGTGLYTIKVHFQVQLSKVGQPVSIQAPEESAQPSETPTTTVKPSRTPRVTPTRTPVKATPTRTKTPMATRTPAAR